MRHDEKMFHCTVLFYLSSITKSSNQSDLIKLIILPKSIRFSTTDSNYHDKNEESVQVKSDVFTRIVQECNTDEMNMAIDVRVIVSNHE